MPGLLEGRKPHWLGVNTDSSADLGRTPMQTIDMPESRRWVLKVTNHCFDHFNILLYFFLAVGGDFG